MRLLLAILLALAAALVVGMLLKNYPGEFMLAFGDTTIHASFAIFIASLFFISAALAMLFTAVLGLIKMPKHYRRWVQQRRHRRSERYLIQGLLNAVTGDWRRAETAFRKGAAYSSAPMLNYLQAARSAQRQGQLQRRDHYLRLAREHAITPEVVVGLTQAELLLDQRETEKAYATLKHLDGNGAGREQANQMLLKTCADLKEWHGLLELLDQMHGSSLLRSEQVRAYQIAAYTGLMQQAGAGGDHERLAAIWNGIPKNLRKDPAILEAYVNERLRGTETGDCEVLLRNVLQRQWDAAIVRLYGLVQGANNAKQLAFAERLLREHARDPVLLLTIGRLSRRNGLWGKARSSFEESLEIQPSPEVCQELATLLEQEGDHVNAAACYRKGLHLATGVNAGAGKPPRPRIVNPGRS